DGELHLSLHQSVKQIPDGKQCKTEGSTPEIEVMASAGFEPPVHPGKQTKCFADMSKDDNHQTSRADYLQERPYVFFSLRIREQNQKEARTLECQLRVERPSFNSPTSTTFVVPTASPSPPVLAMP